MADRHRKKCSTSLALWASGFLSTKCSQNLWFHSTEGEEKGLSSLAGKRRPCIWASQLPLQPSLLWFPAEASHVPMLFPESTRPLLNSAFGHAISSILERSIYLSPLSSFFPSLANSTSPLRSTPKNTSSEATLNSPAVTFCVSDITPFVPLLHHL